MMGRLSKVNAKPVETTKLNEANTTPTLDRALSTTARGPMSVELPNEGNRSGARCFFVRHDHETLLCFEESGCLTIIYKTYEAVCV